MLKLKINSLIDDKDYIILDNDLYIKLYKNKNEKNEDDITENIKTNKIKPIKNLKKSKK